MGSKLMGKPTSSDIASSIRQQLRSIVRLVWDLRSPLLVTDGVEREGKAHWVLPLEHGAHWVGKGLRYKSIGSLSIPDERTVDCGYELAGHIFHLKDRLHQYVKSISSSFGSRDHDLSVENIVNKSLDLRICGDLINLKKHNRNVNRSGLDPSLGNVVLDTSVCGSIEIQYEGGFKATALLVANANSVSRSIELLSAGEVWRKNAVDIFIAALEDWRPLIEGCGLLNGHGSESEFLKMVLSYD